MDHDLAVRGKGVVVGRLCYLGLSDQYFSAPLRHQPPKLRRRILGFDKGSVDYCHFIVLVTNIHRRVKSSVVFDLPDGHQPLTGNVLCVWRSSRAMDVAGRADFHKLALNGYCELNTLKMMVLKDGHVYGSGSVAGGCPVHPSHILRKHNTSTSSVPYLRELDNPKVPKRRRARRPCLRLYTISVADFLADSQGISSEPLIVLNGRDGLYYHSERVEKWLGSPEMHLLNFKVIMTGTRRDSALFSELSEKQFPRNELLPDENSVVLIWLNFLLHLRFPFSAAPPPLLRHPGHPSFNPQNLVIGAAEALLPFLDQVFADILLKSSGALLACWRRGGT